MDTQEEIEIPKIAEKVRFWEEQDRINQELIPRVIKQHELFTAHIEHHESASVHIAALEARIRKAIEAAKEQAADEANAQVSALEANMNATVVSVKRQAFIVSGLGVAVAVCSLIYALVS